MNSKTRNMTVCAIMAALMCILGPMSVPIGPIPISLTNLVIYLTVYLLGTKKACISYLVYMLLGAVGLPVFSGFAGGIGKLAGPTGGYLVGFIFMTVICGVIMERFQRKAIPTWLGARHTGRVSVRNRLVCRADTVSHHECADCVRVSLYSV